MENDVMMVIGGFVLILTTLVFVMNGGLVIALVKIANNRQALSVAETQFEKADQQTQDVIRLVHTSLVLFENLAKQLAPNSELSKAIDTTEDILDEITDGVPVAPDTKPLPDIPTPAPPTTYDGAVG